MAKKKNAIVYALPLCAGVAGLVFGTGLFAEMQKSGSSSGGGQALAHENAELRRDIQDAQQRLSLLKEQLANQGKAGSKSRASKLTELEPINVEGKGLTELEKKIQELKAQLDGAIADRDKITDEEMAAKIKKLRAEFAKAMAEGRGQDALNVLAALAALDERAYPDLVKLWGEMHKAGWPGVGRRARMGMGWGNVDVFHWALTSAGQVKGIEADVLRAFQASSVFSLRFAEQDDAKRAATYNTFLASLPAPAPLTAEQKQLTGFRRFSLYQNDPYRATVAMVSRTNNAQSAQTLSGVISSREVPSDVKVAAVYGLVRQDDPAAEQALADAAADPDPEVKQAAELAQQQQSPPVSGYFVISVEAGSQAATKGIAPGAIIMTYNGQPIRGGRDMWILPQSAEAEDVNMTVYSGGQTLTVQVKSKEPLGIMGDMVYSEADRQAQQGD